MKGAKGGEGWHGQIQSFSHHHPLHTYPPKPSPCVCDVYEQRVAVISASTPERERERRMKARQRGIAQRSTDRSQRDECIHVKQEGKNSVLFDPQPSPDCTRSRSPQTHTHTHTHTGGLLCHTAPRPLTLSQVIVTHRRTARQADRQTGRPLLPPTDLSHTYRVHGQHSMEALDANQRTHPHKQTHSVAVIR